MVLRQDVHEETVCKRHGSQHKPLMAKGVATHRPSGTQLEAHSMLPFSQSPLASCRKHGQLCARLSCSCLWSGSIEKQV